MSQAFHPRPGCPFHLQRELLRSPQNQVLPCVYLRNAALVTKLIMNERSVPALNGGNAPIVAHNAHSCRVEEEKTSIPGSKSKPPRPERSEKVPMSEQRHVAIYRPYLCYDTIDP